MSMDYDDLFKRSLSAGSTDTWFFDGNSDDVVTISAAPTGGLDVWLELLGPTDQSLANVNDGNSGQVETINGVTLPSSGAYEVAVRSVGSTTGRYALVLQTSDALPYVVFKGNLSYGNTVTGDSTLDSDDLWNFEGTAGDIITIRLFSTGDEDLVLYLNDPSSVELDFADDDSSQGPPGDLEEILDLELVDTGLYTIGAGEADFMLTNYTLVLQKNN
jgi:hypothetical protein